MADITINTSAPQYVQMMSALASLRNYLPPKVKLLRKMRERDKRDGTDKARQWLNRDPLLRRIIVMSQTVSEFLDEELSE